MAILKIWSMIRHKLMDDHFTYIVSPPDISVPSQSAVPLYPIKMQIFELAAACVFKHIDLFAKSGERDHLPRSEFSRPH